MSNVSITIELTSVQFKALSCACSNVHDWVDNAATARAMVAYDEIVAKEVARMMADPTIQSIPANKDEIVMNASPTVLFPPLSTTPVPPS
jgi:uncharacterized protein YfaA (DUF2138 family)